MFVFLAAIVCIVIGIYSLRETYSIFRAPADNSEAILAEEYKTGLFVGLGMLGLPPILGIIYLIGN